MVAILGIIAVLLVFVVRSAVKRSGMAKVAQQGRRAKTGLEGAPGGSHFEGNFQGFWASFDVHLDFNVAGVVWSGSFGGARCDDGATRDERVARSTISRARNRNQERRRVRLTYLHGALEIMTTSARHGSTKGRVRRLIEEWLEILDVDISNPLVNKLAVYAGLGVPEVWQWRDGVFRVLVLEGDRYVESERSRLVPAIDLAVVAELAMIEKPNDAVRSCARAKGRCRAPDDVHGL